MLSFGQRLKKLRQQASFSQSYLAENIGVSIQTISNWECDNTMPDISQIVPLANILGVSTDYLLGTGNDEETDKQQLDLQVSKIWATYSVNTFENNADYMVYELYKDFLRKYPLNYEIKYKCSLALHDYLVVSHVRHKFEIAEKDFDKLYAECEKLLYAICNNDTNIQRQIETRKLLIQHYTLKNQWDKAETIAEQLPEICGIKNDVLRTIAQSKGSSKEALEFAKLSSKQKCQEYVMSLFYRANCMSSCDEPNKTTVIQAWKDMASTAKMFIDLFADPSDLTVNSYEKNPYCYLITAYTSMSNSYLKFSDFDNALNCVEHATNTAIKLYKWGTDNSLDRLVIEDIVYFVKNTPRWCFSFSKLYSNDDNPFSNNPRYKQCITRILELINKE